MGKIYDNHINQLQNKFGLNKLTVEPDDRRTPIDLTPTESKDSRFYKQNMQRMKDKFGIDRIELANPLEKRIEHTLAEFVDEHEAEQVKHLKLCVGKTQYQGKKLNLWFAVSKEM